MSNYALESLVRCTWIRRGYTDHYRVDAGGSRYVFRICLSGKHTIQSEDDFRFELGLLRALDAGGAPVAMPIQRRDGGFLGSLGGGRTALFERASGDPIVGSIGTRRESSTKLLERSAGSQMARPLCKAACSPHVDILLARSGRLKPLAGALDRCERDRRTARIGPPYHV